MMAQKNHMDPPITEPYPPENEFDFEILWRCISKFGERLKGGAWEEDYSNLNNTIVYINSIVQFGMFILVVSSPFGLVTGEPEGVLWWSFEFWCGLTKFLLYNVHCVHQEKFKNSKKLLHVDLPFFIRKVFTSADLAICGLKQSNRVYIPDWLGWFCVLCMLLLYNSVRF